jgi:4-hydroxybenzoate polyprenyltransferase
MTNVLYALLILVALALAPVALVLAIPGVVFVIIYLLVKDYRESK